MKLPPVGNNWIGLALTGALLVVMPGSLLAFGFLLARRLRNKAHLHQKPAPVLRTK